MSLEGKNSKRGKRNGLFTKKSEVNSELNLIPIMNLLVALIPFLLINLAFYHMGSVAITVPGISEENDSSVKIEKKLEKKVIVHLIIEDKIYKIDIFDEDSGSPMESKLFRFSSADEEFARNSAADLILGFKKNYPKSEVFLVTADPNMSYEKFVELLDSFRYGNLTDESKDKKQLLFSKLVLVPNEDDSELKEI